MAGKFLYFAYGSNLLRERLLLRNPSAIFKTIGKLEKYVLAFAGHSENWCGSPATIRSEPNGLMWGTVWELEDKHKVTLDRQEGVDVGEYRPLEIQVETPGGERLTCRTYQLQRITDETRPSPQYLEVIVRGAEQSGLPEEYIRTLEAIEHNGYAGQVALFQEVEQKRQELKTQGAGESCAS